MSERIENRLIGILRAIGVIFLVGIAAFPFYWMVLASLQPLIETLQNPTQLWPSRIDFSAYVKVWTQFKFGLFFRNSAYLAILTTALTVAFSTLAAYAIARLRFRGRSLMSRVILLIYMFPAIVIATPMYALYTQLGLRNNLNGLLLVYMAQTLPVAIYMLHSYFKTLPPDLEEAGLMDGCSRLGVIWRVTLPLSAPAIASVCLYTFMIAWNEFLFAFLFLDSPSSFTLSRGIMQIANNVNVSQQLTMAAAVIATLPVIVIFLVFERHLVKGLTSGGVKG
ncbi:MAG: carbohydrate ABC transporter permease [Pseudanabaenales cyanobacterium]|nr:carbohydrate ABC transporter permease [Pseudanabaenales cyanobacterium]